jgi:hypothetical protein
LRPDLIVVPTSDSRGHAPVLSAAGDVPVLFVNESPAPLKMKT